MSDYTPTTHEARSAWINYRLDCYRFGRENFGSGDASGREFDRWLNSVEAETAATALDKAIEVIEAEYLEDATGQEDDVVYGNALSDAVRAVSALRMKFCSEAE